MSLPPLPNLPESLNELYSDERDEVRGFARAYAKLAVREALQPLVDEFSGVAWNGELVARLRAIIKEHE